MEVSNVILTLGLYSYFPSLIVRSLNVPIQGVPPVTVAEWTLEGDGFQDWYDGESCCSDFCESLNILCSVPRGWL